MEELVKYKQRGFFEFYPLSTKKDCFTGCNAPTDASGIYLIYGINGKNKVLVYIGSSGKLRTDGKIKHRLTGLGGLKDRLINGTYKYSISGLKVSRYIFWKERMKEEGFEKLRIKWFVTHGTDYIDCPTKIEASLIEHFTPSWNRS